jgi:hypothetical protein
MRVVTRWAQGEQTVNYRLQHGRLETFQSDDFRGSANAQISRAALRVEVTALAALRGGDVDGAYVAAYDGYRMAAESILTLQGLRATGGDGSHMTVEDAVSAQFADIIPVFARPIFERFRRTRHAAQYFDPDAAPITEADALWGIEKANDALAGVRSLLSGIDAGSIALGAWE